jgi:competence protein ComEC
MIAAWEIPVPVIFFPAVAAPLLAGMLFVRSSAGHTLLLYLLLALLGAASMTLDLSATDPDAVEGYVRPGATTSLRCRITDMPRMAGSTVRFVAEAESVATGGVLKSVHGPVAVVLRRDTIGRTEDSTLVVGRSLSLDGELAFPARARNPGEFDFREYLMIHGIHAEMFQAAGTRADVHPIDYGGIVDRCVVPVRSAIAARIDSLFAGEEATFLRGLIIGDRSELGMDMKSAFINSGVMHILAVSGLHVAVVVLMLLALVRPMRLPDLAEFALLAACLLYYIPLTGGSPSVARSVLMALVMLGGKVVQRKVDMINTLAVSAIVLLLIDAKQLMDPGFQLSYMAVLALVVGFPRLNVRKRGGWIIRIVKLGAAAVAVSVAASLGTFPVTAFHFGRISIIGIAANVIVVPLSNAVLGLGMLAVAASFVSGWVGSAYAAAAHVCTQLLLEVVRWFGSIPFASTSVSLGVAGMVLSYLALGLLLGCASRRYRRAAIIAACLAVDAGMAYWIVRPAPEPVLRVTVLDVGQGDAIVVEFPDESAMVLDAGPALRITDMGATVVMPFLRRNAIRELSAVLVSHPHEDHLGGMPSVLRSERVRSAIDAGFGRDGRLAAQYVRLCDSLHLDRQAVHAGEVLPSPGTCRLYLLHPTAAAAREQAQGGSGLNNQSLVLKLVYGSTSILLSGDAERESEAELVRLYGDFLRSDVLKAGHHGSATSSTEEYLAAVRPKRVVISVGRRNRFHHPSPAVIERLKASGSEVLRTDESGAIVLESDGRVWRTVAWR